MSDGTTRLAEIAAEYRKSFDAVQQRLATLDLGTIPSWVFGIDRFDIVELADLDRELARLEQRRRQWRAALHAMAELTALETHDVVADSPEKTLDPESFDDVDLAEITKTAEPAGLPALDRFISVVQFARSAGCMYIDGGFAPVVKGKRS